MSDMVPTGSKYTDEDRMKAAVVYGAYGTFMAVERELNIPNNTVCNWSKTEWWDEAVAKVRDEKSEEHRAMYSQIVDASQAKALELIPDMKDAKAAVLMACMGTDKIRLADNMPTSISGKGDNNGALMDQLRQLSSSLKEKNINVIKTVEKGPSI